MNRRGFLKALGAGAVGVVATPAILEALAPTRSIFLPPPGGWFRANLYGGKLHENLVQVGALRYPTPQEILDEAERTFQEMCRNGGQDVEHYVLSPPQFLTNYFDPKVLEILLAPVRADTLQLEWLDG